MGSLFDIETRVAQKETERERQTKKQDCETTYSQLSLCHHGQEQPVRNMSRLNLSLMNINGKRRGELETHWSDSGWGGGVDQLK